MVQDPSPSPADAGLQPWYLVANASRARAYVRRIAAPGYDVVREWDSPEARMNSAELGEDRPGRVFASAGVDQRSGIQEEREEATPKGHAQRDLQHQVVDDLVRAFRGGDMAGLYLVAPAPLLHRLRDALPTDLRRAVAGEHAGDFTQRPTADIFDHLDALRRGP